MKKWTYSLLVFVILLFGAVLFAGLEQSTENVRNLKIYGGSFIALSVARMMFSYLKKKEKSPVKNSAFSGDRLGRKLDTCEMIASNIAYNIAYLKQNKEREEIDSDNILVMAGTINAIQYIFKGEMLVEKISECLDYSLNDKLAGNDYNAFETGELKDELLFILNMEYLMFQVDSEMSNSNILKALKEKESDIVDIMTFVYRKVKNEGLYDHMLNANIEMVLGSMESE